MIVSGSVVLAFWHCFLRFWVPEMVYVDASPLNETYFHELVEI
jgi:hypothetical protein